MVRLYIFLFLIFPVAATAQSTRTSQNSPSQPQAQAVRVYKVIRDQDWRSLYFLIAVSPNIKLPPSPDQFEREFLQGFESEGPEQAEKNRRFLDSISDITTGVPTITGRKADVPTSAKIMVAGVPRIFKGVAHLIRDNRTWKLDLTAADTVADLGRVTSEQVVALIGKLDTGPR
jgi:hypothetical protein